ncbi:uncharacterized protein BKA55DRAFT_584429 [Fusarium redolens]|uniref:RING-type domain-containing protein n=1 Tax=Fusarium redolens TaxID=48865 RepID=A0A9P9JUA0_FUSRE|nr:uncharacterized protein BKA55DRAFT_584429 [Fusarium redolens]KAH7224310.1 hypothetical protein BKA55DRAFT_584429 [Fusarium redolens]
MPVHQQQSRQRNTNLLIHDIFQGGENTTVHWEPVSQPVAVAWPIECLVSHEAKRHCITQQDVNNLVDFGDLEYTSKIKDQLVCPICIGVFVTPIVTPCGHLFCLEYIQKHHRTCQCCPLDRRRIQANRTRLAKGLMDEIGGLDVLCPNSKLGCTREMRRDGVVQHLLTCCYTAENLLQTSRSKINTDVT